MITRFFSKQPDYQVNLGSQEDLSKEKITLNICKTCDEV